MQHEMVHKPPPSGGFLQWWSNDQTFFNEVVHRAQPIGSLGLSLKAPSQATRAQAKAMALEAYATNSPARKAILDAAFEKVESVMQV